MVLGCHGLHSGNPRSHYHVLSVVERALPSFHPNTGDGCRHRCHPLPSGTFGKVVKGKQRKIEVEALWASTPAAVVVGHGMQNFVICVAILGLRSVRLGSEV